MSGNVTQWCIADLLAHLNTLAEAYEDLAIEHAMEGHMTSVNILANLHRMAAKIKALDYEDRTSSLDGLLGQIECLLEQSARRASEAMPS